MGDILYIWRIHGFTSENWNLNKFSKDQNLQGEQAHDAEKAKGVWLC